MAPAGHETPRIWLALLRDPQGGSVWVCLELGKGGISLVRTTRALGALPDFIETPKMMGIKGLKVSSKLSSTPRSPLAALLCSQGAL